MELQFFRVVLRLSGTKKFKKGQIFLYIIYYSFISANNRFSKIWSIIRDRDGCMCQSWAKMSNFIPLSLRPCGIEFSLVLEYTVVPNDNIKSMSLAPPSSRIRTDIPDRIILKTKQYVQCAFNVVLVSTFLYKELLSIFNFHACDD